MSGNKDLHLVREVQDLTTAVTENGKELARVAGELLERMPLPEQPGGKKAVGVSMPEINIEVNVPPLAQPTIEITVPTPVVNVAPAAVSVEAPDVRVTPEIQVNVPPPVPIGYRVQVTRRDANGMIAEFVISPI